VITLAEEAQRYLAAVDEMRAAGVHLEWRTEAEELGPLPGQTSRVAERILAYTNGH